MIVETRKQMGDCDDCGNESRLPMIVPWIWLRIAPATVHDEADHRTSCGGNPERCRCGILCQRCAERRLGRKLEAGDFQQSIAIATAWRGVTGRFQRIGERVREVLR